jgi:hypothetical protein
MPAFMKIKKKENNKKKTLISCKPETFVYGLQQDRIYQLSCLP